MTLNKTEKERQSQISDSKTEEYLQMKQKLKKEILSRILQNKDEDNSNTVH